MQLLSLLSITLYCVVGASLAVRLLRLWRRTRQLPELLLGLCLAMIAGVGYPFAVLAGALQHSAPTLTQVAFVCSMLGVCGGSFVIYPFVWKVFRPRSTWAEWIVLSAGVGFVIIAAGNIYATLNAPPGAGESALTESFVRWMTGFFFVSNAGFAWSAVESLSYYAKLRRRLKLDLIDPVVVNRFLLWGLMTASVTTISTVNATYMHLGENFVTHPVPLLVAATLGFANSLFTYLALLPPESYQRWLRERAAAAQA